MVRAPSVFRQSASGRIQGWYALPAMKRLRHCAILGVLVLSACSPKASSPVRAEAQYLYLWTASADTAQPDFLAVLDVTEYAMRATAGW